MELANVLLLLKGNWKHPLAAISGVLWLILHPVDIYCRRQDTQKRRRISDHGMKPRFYSKSIVVQYFLKGVRSVQDLPGFGEGLEV